MKKKTLYDRSVIGHSNSWTILHNDCKAGEVGFKRNVFVKTVLSEADGAAMDHLPSGMVAQVQMEEVL
ncbi:hypothetical protein M514_27342 [Trichuris suis]|uniref:Uncharacterized protein n=1 Tax=Trichuris suis TaxID=68888 RepID=A0A085MTB6_9BILA|nr:hypothetical protein M514_27342 [Trichuris suis]